MSWGPTPVLPGRNPTREWFQVPPEPPAPQHQPYWHAYHEALLAGRLQALTAALTGSHGQVAELTGRLHPLTGALVGEHSTAGQIAAALQSLKFAGTNIITSNLTGSLQPLHAAMVGDQAFAGTLAGSLMPLRASISADQILTGQLTGALQPLRASLSGSQIIDSTLAGQLRPITAALTGTQSQTGTLAATLRALLFSGLGTHSQSGVVSGTLRPLSGALVGSLINAVRFDNSTDLGHGGTTTRTGLHTNTGNCIVVVFTNTTSSPATCTYGGVNIPRVYGPTQGGIVFPYNAYCSIFALVSNSLPQGSNTVSCTQASNASAACAITFKNAGSLGAVITDNAVGAVNISPPAGIGRAAVCGYVAGSNNFGTLTPNQAMRYTFSAFDTWASLAGWAEDSSGGGITFNATQATTKAGAVVPILPAA